MDSKQLNIINIDKIKELTPEVYNNEMNTSRPFFILHSLLYKKGENIISTQYNINQTELDVLASLYYSSKENFSLTPTELYEIMLFSSGGMTKVLKKLEEKEYIRRIENSEDKRSKLVQITSLGKEITEKALKDIVTFEANYFSKLTNNEQDQLKTLLYKILD